MQMSYFNAGRKKSYLDFEIFQKNEHDLGSKETTCVDILCERMTDSQQTTDLEYGWTATEETLSSYFVVFLSILALVLFLSSILHKSRLSSILPEAGLTVIIGIISGILIHYLGNLSVEDDLQDDVVNEEKEVAEDLLSFDSKVPLSGRIFVYLLLSNFTQNHDRMWKEYFIRYFKPIALYAIVGTSISTLIVAFTLYIAVKMNLSGGFEPSLPELLTFGALISATDPVSTLAVFQEKCVCPQLFYLVFGESVLNDAVGLVLFNTLAKFVGQKNTLASSSEGLLLFLIDFVISFVGSMTLGLFSGVMAGFFLKLSDMRENRILELSSYILVMYAPFFAAEVLPLSGIVTSLFTGIAAKQYAEQNLTPQTAEDADVIFRVISHLAETSLFLELGLSVFGLAFENFHFLFILFAILGCLLGRLLNVYPITWLVNKSIQTEIAVNENEVNGGQYTLQNVRQQKIDMNTAHMLWFSGLRGAVAYACAKSFPDDLGNRAPFVITTMMIVLLTIFLLGSTTECVLHILNIEMNMDENQHSNEEICQNQMSIVHKFENNGVMRMTVSNHENEDETEETTAEFEMREMGDFSLSSPSSNEKKESIYDYGVK